MKMSGPMGHGYLMTKKPINSKQKGKRGELEFASLLRSFGYTARRGQQFKGTEDSPDISCPELPFHYECKRTERINIRKSYLQACRDGGNHVPIVCFRGSREPWMVTLSAEDFLNIIKYWPLLKPPG